MPILDSVSMKSGSTAPKSPRQRCRGLTASPGHCRPRPVGAHSRTARPRADAGGESADLLKHELRERTGLQRAVLHLRDLTTQFLFEVRRQRRRRLGRGDDADTRRVEEKASVAEAVPAEEVGPLLRTHTRPPAPVRPDTTLGILGGWSGTRISIATGNTWPAPDIA